MSRLGMPSGRLLAAGLVAGSAVLPLGSPGIAAAAPAAGAAPPERTLGFVLSKFWYAMYEGDVSCPNGPAVGMDELAAPRVPKAERNVPKEEYFFKLRMLTFKGHTTARVMPGLLPEDPAASPVFGLPGLNDQCLHPEQFDDPPHALVGGRHAFGMNLDGTDGSRVAPNSCAHEKFTTPDGTPGIDNQLYRVIGCTNAYRHDFPYSPNITNEYRDKNRKGGGVTTLIEVTGVDNVHDDADVTVGIYSSANPTRFDGEGNGIPFTSLTVSEKPEWRATTKGRIQKGVLTIDPVDVRLYQPQYLGAPAEYYLRGTHLALTLNEDGTAKGMLAGYFDIAAAFKLEYRGGGEALRGAPWGYTCPAMWAALTQNADGYPDPKTGKCTAISTALNVEAVPAFIVHRRDEQTAQR